MSRRMDIVTRSVTRTMSRQLKIHSQSPSTLKYFESRRVRKKRPWQATGKETRKTETVPSKRKRLAPESKPAVETHPKPFKVCDVGRTQRFGIAASNLKELRLKIEDVLPIKSYDFEVVLEEDCTRVEDDEYLQALEDNTVLMVVGKGEHWAKASTSLAEDTEGLVEVDGAGPSDSSGHLARVAEKIARNPALMAFLPKIDLEVVRDSDVNQLQVLLRQSKEDAQFIQDACEKRLGDIIQSEDAMALLKLYHDAKTAQPKTAQAKTAQAKTAQAKTAQAKTAQAKTAQAKTAQAKTAQAKTAQAKTAQAKTAQAKTAQAKTAQAKTAQAKTAQAKQTQAEKTQVATV